MRRTRLISLIGAATLILGLLAGPALAARVADGPGGRPITASLDGAQEVGSAGDPDGSGTVRVALNPGQGTICYDLTVRDIAAATQFHVHEAPRGENGPVVVGFFGPPGGQAVSFDGCVEADRELIRDIIKDPADYYFNVHNAEFPAGAIRGQLG